MARPTEKADTEVLARNLGEEYAQYFLINTSSEKQQLSSEIESMMTCLEDYRSVLKKTCLENFQLMDEEVPKIFTHYQTLLRTFQSIDNLERLVGEVKSDLVQLEVAVAKAEKDLKVGPNIADVFKPFISKKDYTSSLVLAAGNESISFRRPTLKFSPENYFPSQSGAPSQKEA